MSKRNNLIIIIACLALLVFGGLWLIISSDDSAPQPVADTSPAGQTEEVSSAHQDQYPPVPEDLELGLTNMGTEEWWQNWPDSCSQMWAAMEAAEELTDNLRSDRPVDDSTDIPTYRALSANQMTEAITSQSLANAHWTGCGDQFRLIEYGALADTVDNLDLLPMAINCDQWRFWFGLNDTDLPDFIQTMEADWSTFLDNYILTNTPYWAVGCNDKVFTYYYQPP